MCVCYLRGFPSESIYKTNRKRANPRFRIAAIYPSVNIQPLMKTPKIDIQHHACCSKNDVANFWLLLLRCYICLGEMPLANPVPI
jgi:hypothetical protein